MPTAILSSKSQFVLPAEIRRKLGIRPGDRLAIEVEGGHAVIRKLLLSDVEALADYRSKIWHGYADELEEARGEWDP